MKVRNGYVLSKKGNQTRWRKLPRLVWLKIQRDRLLKIANNQQEKKQP